MKKIIAVLLILISISAFSLFAEGLSFSDYLNQFESIETLKEEKEIEIQFDKTNAFSSYVSTMDFVVEDEVEENETLEMPSVNEIFSSILNPTPISEEIEVVDVVEVVEGIEDIEIEIPYVKNFTIYNSLEINITWTGSVIDCILSLPITNEDLISITSFLRENYPEYLTCLSCEALSSFHLRLTLSDDIAISDSQKDAFINGASYVILEYLAKLESSIIVDEALEILEPTVDIESEIAEIVDAALLSEEITESKLDKQTAKVVHSSMSDVPKKEDAKKERKMKFEGFILASSAFVIDPAFNNNTTSFGLGLGLGVRNIISFNDNIGLSLKAIYTNTLSFIAILDIKYEDSIVFPSAVVYTGLGYGLEGLAYSIGASLGPSSHMRFGIDLTVTNYEEYCRFMNLSFLFGVSF